MTHLSINTSFVSQICFFFFPSLFEVIFFLLLQGVFLEKIKSENPGVPCFLLGHSTGGAVVLKVMPYQDNLLA